MSLRVLIIGFKERGLVHSIEKIAKKRKFKSYIDVGAYTGDSLIPTAKYFDICLAIEPSPLSSHTLRRKLMEGRIRNCVVEECAFGNKPGMGYLRVNETNESDTSVVQRKGLDAGPKVEVSTLDEVSAKWAIAEPILINLDVGGIEPLIVSGGRRTLDRDCTIVSRFSPWSLKRNGFDPIQYVETMESYRFGVRNLGGNAISRSKLTAFCKRSEEKMCSTNIIFLRS
jgi:FkbM family methyltransferase